MDYITPIKDKLDFWMHKNCLTFMSIGTPKETPRYFNFKGFDMETKELSIGSTQTNIGFTIPTEFRFVDSREFWQQFKEYRTSFLVKNYPTIEVY